MNNDYKIPTEIKSELAVGFGVFLKDLIIIGFFYLLMSFFEKLIFEDLKIVYEIFNVIFAFYLTRKTSENPSKRIYHKYLFALFKKYNQKYAGLETENREIKYMEN